MAQLARHHRRSVPRASDPEDAPPPADRSHAGGVRLSGPRRQEGGWTLEVGGANPLDLVGAREKADLWAREFGSLSLQAGAAAEVSSPA